MKRHSWSPESPQDQGALLKDSDDGGCGAALAAWPEDLEPEPGWRHVVLAHTTSRCKPYGLPVSLCACADRKASLGVQMINKVLYYIAYGVSSGAVKCQDLPGMRGERAVS